MVIDVRMVVTFGRVVTRRKHKEGFCCLVTFHAQQVEMQWN